MNPNSKESLLSRQTVLSRNKHARCLIESIKSFGYWAIGRSEDRVALQIIRQEPGISFKDFWNRLESEKGKIFNSLQVHNITQSLSRDLKIQIVDTSGFDDDMNLVACRNYYPLSTLTWKAPKLYR